MSGRYWVGFRADVLVVVTNLGPRASPMNSMTRW
jgi:hypothetical protein